MEVRAIHLHVVRPVLVQLARGRPYLCSYDAEWMVVRTAVVESKFAWVRQDTNGSKPGGDGPGRGFWQIEPMTMGWLLDEWLAVRPELRDAMAPFWPADDGRLLALTGDMRLGAALCRLRYAADKRPIPPHDDLGAQAAFWKRVYNTRFGAGHPEDFLDACRLIEPWYRSEEWRWKG